MIPDNSADYKIFSYAFEGLGQVRSVIADKTPTAFILWHHGAQVHAEYAMAQVLPETAYFSSYVFQYGKIFTYAIYKAKNLSLLKMQRFLCDGRAVCLHLDSPPLGETTSLKIFGVPADLSTGPIKIIQSVKGIRLVPVTSYYSKNKSVKIIFHVDFPEKNNLPHLSTRDLMASLIRFFEQDQRNRAPEQVMWWFLVKRVLHLENLKP